MYAKIANTAFVLLMGSFLAMLIIIAAFSYLVFYPIVDTTSCEHATGVLADRQTDYALNKICKRLKNKKVEIYECAGR